MFPIDMNFLVVYSCLRDIFKYTCNKHETSSCGLCKNLPLSRHFCVFYDIAKLKILSQHLSLNRFSWRLIVETGRLCASAVSQCMLCHKHASTCGTANNHLYEDHDGAGRHRRWYECHFCSIVFSCEVFGKNN